MNPGWKVFWLFGSVFAVTRGLERTFTADVVPLAFAGEPQPIELAFALRTLELISGSVSLIALILMCGVWAEHLRGVKGKLKARFAPAEKPRWPAR